MRFVQQLFPVLASAAAALAQYCPGADTAGTPCTNGLFVLSARGTEVKNGDPLYNQNPFTTGPNYTDQQGQEDVAKAVINKRGGYCRSLPYAASSLPAYFLSVLYGEGQTQSIVKEYVDRCKSTVSPKIVLLGYSQGGQVMTGALIDGLYSPALDSYKQYIVGGAFFASPSFVANYTIDAGNSTTSGLLQRGPLDYAYFNTTYSNRIRNYCQAGDRFCASGSLLDQQSLDIHEAEVNTYKQDAIKFLLTKV